MSTLVTSIEIEAAPESVWAVLTDLSGYETWNPHIVAATGTVEPGERIEAEMRMGEDRTITMKPTVTVAEAPSRFEWLGHTGIRGIFDGRHRFDLESTENGTRLTQSEKFTGFLAPLVLRFIGENTRAGFESMNTAIKERVEKGVTPASDGS